MFTTLMALMGEALVSLRFLTAAPERMEIIGRALQRRTGRFTRNLKTYLRPSISAVLTGLRSSVTGGGLPARPVGGVLFHRSNVTCAAVSRRIRGFFTPKGSPAFGLQLSNVTCMVNSERVSSGSPRREGRCVTARPHSAPVFGSQRHQSSS